MNISCEDITIDSVDQGVDKSQYLGLKINQKMDSMDIVSSIVSKCNSRLKFMYRQAKHLPISSPPKKKACAIP